MSEERELLKKCLGTFQTINVWDDCLIKEIIGLLAQPEQEQEPVAWGYKKRVTYKPEGSEEEEIIPLYTAPPKREPIDTRRITLKMFSKGVDMQYKNGYVDGIRFAEKAHGITGGGE